ncbi:hypothetical protein BTVI_151081 [Pitangus sulphuratus]|nr:hypothetical protein BTVI_151081 [Pitangus sulphuratus]
MLSYVLLSALLLSVQAEQYCGAREILRYTKRLLPGHELACFVEGTQHMLKTSVSSKPVLARLHQTFQALLDRNLCEDQQLYCLSKLTDIHVTDGSASKLSVEGTTSYSKKANPKVLQMASCCVLNSQDISQNLSGYGHFRGFHYPGQPHCDPHINTSKEKLD